MYGSLPNVLCIYNQILMATHLLSEPLNIHIYYCQFIEQIAQKNP